MTSLEKISANMKLIDWKRNRVRNAILSLTLEWKDFDEYLDSTQRSVEECVEEIESREKNLDSIRKSVTESSEELDVVRRSIENRVEELESREKKFQEQIEEFELKNERIDLIRKSREEYIKEVELREERLCQQQKSIERLFEKFELEEKQFESMEKLISEGLLDINAKERHIESRSKEIGTIQNWIERRALEVDTKEEHVEERSKELDRIQKLTEERSNEVELKEKQVDSVSKSNEERSESIDSREKQLDSTRKFATQCFQEFRLQKKQLRERSRELESKEKQLEDWSKELELKEKNFGNVLQSHENAIEPPLDIMPTENAIEQPHDLIPTENAIEQPTHDIVMPTQNGVIDFDNAMDGKNLQIYLNEHVKERNMISHEVFNALRLSLDPAKLVLDAIEGFYLPHLKKGDTEFKGNVVRRSCIFLLEQLMRISPIIQPRVKKAALKIADEWKEKMKSAAEILGFLQLLASYKLAFAFNGDELLYLVETVAQNKKMPELCSYLCLTDKIPDLIRNLVSKQQHLVAISYIFAFELVEEFPPVPLIKAYVRLSKMIRKKEKNSLQANKAIDKRVAALRAVIKCIVDYQLESKYSPRGLENCIEHLLRQKVQPQQTVENKIATMALILSNMDGTNLQVFLNEHSEEHDLIRDEVLAVLRLSVDSARLVLDVMQGFYPPHLKNGDVDFEANICRRSCILLLELLMRVSPKINAEIKDEAMKLAVDWKAKIISESGSPMEILGFLQLVGSYRLVSAFDANELIILFGSVIHLRPVPELCPALGFSKKIIDNLQVNKTAKSLTSASNPIILTTDPAKLVLDALHGCYKSNLDGNNNFNCSKVDFMRSSIDLLEQLVNVSPEIKPHVKEEAMKFAVHWKVNVAKRRRPWEISAFLQLLDTYKLITSFNADELLSLVDMLPISKRKHKQAINLIRVLELADKIPDRISTSRSPVSESQLMEQDRRKRVAQNTPILNFEGHSGYPHSHKRYRTAISEEEAPPNNPLEAAFPGHSVQPPPSWHHPEISYAEQGATSTYLRNRGEPYSFGNFTPIDPSMSHLNQQLMSHLNRQLMGANFGSHFGSDANLNARAFMETRPQHFNHDLWTYYR